MIMNLQYISDSSGKTTGVFIPIKEWNELKNKFKGIELEDIHIPNWHMALVLKRLEEYKKNPKTIDFNTAMDDIEKNL